MSAPWAALGEVHDARRVAGGDINEAWSLRPSCDQPAARWPGARTVTTRPRPSVTTATAAAMAATCVDGMVGMADL